VAAREGAARAAEKGAGRPEAERSRLGELPALAGAVAVALLIRTFLFQSFYVPSDSMLPTLLVGDHVFVNKVVYGLKIPWTARRVGPWRAPRRGEVVVFQLGRGQDGIYPADLRPELPNDAFVKRVVGLPGDRIAVRGGRVVLNGETLPLEPTGEVFTDAEGRRYDVYLETLGECRHRVLDDPLQPGIDMEEVEVKPGRFLFFGDNRDNSYDGRKFGTVRLHELEGPAGLLYWSWDWNGSWLALLNPLTWWNNLLHHTRWSRIGDFDACLPAGGMPPAPRSSAG
jgi:signal peptidase I